jgi:hypothetical protein
MIATLLVAGFLLAHGLVHACYLMTPPAASTNGPAWPFDLADSWALTPNRLDPRRTRQVGLVLVVATVAAFALAAVTALGILPSGGWVALVSLGSVASIALLALFFHRWLVIGVGIDLALLWAVLVAAWVPQPL